MSQNQPREIAVFIASPGDLAPERKAFKETVDALNQGFADGANVKFVPLGWEDVLAETGRRAQGVINQELEKCDVFILALHRRWGQSASDSKYTSYTEEEFEIARQLWKQTDKPEVLVFFKNVDAASIADPGRELKKVLKFRKTLERQKVTLFKTFNTESDFATEIDRHLRGIAKGEFEKLDPVSAVTLPRKQMDSLDKAERTSARQVERAEKKVAQKPSKGKGKGSGKGAVDLSLVKSYQVELALARAAAEAADDGKIQDATILFAQATEGTTDPSILSLAAEFFRQVGDLENSTRLVKRQAAITRDREVAYEHYLALLPDNWVSSQRAQLEAQLLQLAPQEIVGELKAVNDEMWGGGRLEEFLRQVTIKHLTTEELMLNARFLGSPEGQSLLHKQQQMAADMLNYVARETDRILAKRYGVPAPPVVVQTTELPELPEPKRLAAGGSQPAEAPARSRKKQAK